MTETVLLKAVCYPVRMGSSVSVSTCEKSSQKTIIETTNSDLSSSSSTVNTVEQPCADLLPITIKQIVSHDAFFEKVQKDIISLNNAEIYVKKHPDCLYIVDVNLKSIIQYAGKNKNRELFCMFIEQKMKQSRFERITIKEVKSNETTAADKSTALFANIASVSVINQ